MPGFEVLRAHKLVTLTDAPIGPRYDKERREEQQKDDKVECFFNGVSYFFHISVRT
jgi:hypothetical protein